MKHLYLCFPSISLRHAYLLISFGVWYSVPQHARVGLTLSENFPLLPVKEVQEETNGDKNQEQRLMEDCFGCNR